MIFHNELELGRTERQELVLMPCILKISNSTRLKINSTNGDIPLGIEVTVSHNTQLYFFCGDPNCTLISNGHNETRCANGTFQPAVTQDGCRCPGGKLELLINAQYYYVIYPRRFAIVEYNSYWNLHTDDSWMFVLLPLLLLLLSLLLQD